LISRKKELRKWEDCKGYVRRERFMDIQGQLATEAPRRKEDERTIMQKTGSSATATNCL
jgi:hypothetical protein